MLGLLAAQVVSAQSKNQPQRLTKADSIMLIEAGIIPGSSYAKAIPKTVDTSFVPVVDLPAITTTASSIYKHRLDSITKEVPLDYNEFVQTYIDIYTGPHRKAEIGKILGRTKYYFPIYEKAFHDAGIPEEIKYLSVVESALDPYAVSRVGATGPWQFMFTTGKLYGLTIDNYIDERRDPIQASYAAAAYIRDAYQDFGDWLVAIASYNCGKSNITRAIAKAGATDFWSIRKYLPLETRNYVPAYIAIAYVMNYYEKHGIMPADCDFSVKTDTVLVNKFISLAAVANVTHLDMHQLCMLNPQYKKLIVNGSDAAPKRLVIPQVEKDVFATLYNVLNDPNFTSANYEPEHAVYNEFLRSKAGKGLSHKVKKGESLASIADKYGVEVQDLKVWNHLHSLKAKPGQVLKVSAASSSVEKYASVSSKHKIKNYITYKVKRGDTLSQIAERFDGITVAQLKELNGLKTAKVKPGMTLKISKG